jgi:hypothetical protein
LRRIGPSMQATTSSTVIAVSAPMVHYPGIDSRRCWMATVKPRGSSDRWKPGGGLRATPLRHSKRGRGSGVRAAAAGRGCRLQFRAVTTSPEWRTSGDSEAGCLRSGLLSRLRPSPASKVSLPAASARTNSPRGSPNGSSDVCRLAHDASKLVLIATWTPDPKPRSCPNEPTVHTLNDAQFAQFAPVRSVTVGTCDYGSGGRGFESLPERTRIRPHSSV